MEEQNRYTPGICNIGDAEIKKRLISGWTGIIFAVFLYILLISIDAPRIWRLVIFIPSTIAAIGFLQAYMHFCAYFGSHGVFNFGEVGRTDTVEQEEFRAKDLRKALQIIVYSIIIGAATSGIAYYF